MEKLVLKFIKNQGREREPNSKWGGNGGDPLLHRHS